MMHATNNTGNEQQQEQRLVETTQQHREDWVDSVVDVATSVKKLFTRHTCRVCQIYVDEQVEFERRQQESDSDFSTSNWMNPTSRLEVELYRQFLFDEDSVVEYISDRQGCEGHAAEANPADNDQHTVTTQRTQ